MQYSRHFEGTLGQTWALLASEWHSGGQGFNSPRLHQTKTRFP